MLNLLVMVMTYAGPFIGKGKRVDAYMPNVKPVGKEKRRDALMPNVKPVGKGKKATKGHAIF